MAMTVDSFKRNRRQNGLHWYRQPQDHARIGVYLVSDEGLKKVGVGRGQNLTLYVLSLSDNALKVNRPCFHMQTVLDGV